MSTTSLESQEFGKLRSFLWPVYRHELKKFVPMILIFFMLFFDYNILRTMKDSLVVTAKASGAEVIPFIKVWVLLPSAVLMTFIFTRLSNRFSLEKVFYIMVTLFLVYFFVFAFYLYPNKDQLHFHAFADTLQGVLPKGFKGFIAMFRNWTFTTFYVMSELWGSVIIFLLFWGFANQVTKLSEAKRFYGLFGIGLNISGMVAGQTCVYICRAYGPEAWESSMMALVAVVLLCGVCAIAIFRWLNKNVLNDELGHVSFTEGKKEEKQKLSIRDSFAYLMRSPYLFSLALIVLAYNLVINLVEVVWKDQVGMLNPNPSDFTDYMSQVTSATSLIATLTAIFISGQSIRRLGWTFTAMLTPAVLMLSSIGFFGFYFFKDGWGQMVASFLGFSPLAIVVFMGSFQNIMSRAAKYTLFDSTKEMAFIPLSQECKVKGKAAIDGVCSRLGKSAGSAIHLTLFMFFHTIPECAPFVAAILFAAIGVWIVLVYLLGKKFNALTKKIHPIDERTKAELVEGEELLASVAS
jgi:ATP:ADP antiporter, AAA family